MLYTLCMCVARAVVVCSVRYVFIGGSIIFMGTIVNAREFPILHYTVNDGLPSTTVYSIYRDTKGFLWFATDKGIARYNGARFESFTTSDGLPDNEVFLFKEDYQGRLWLSTYNGELCFYKDGVFHTEANTPFLKLPVRQTHIYNITVEKDSSVTFNFYDHTILVNVKNERLSAYDFKLVKSQPRMNYIYYKRKVAPNIFELIYEEDILLVDTRYNVLSVKKRKWPGGSVYVPVQDKGYFINIPSYISKKFQASDNLIYSSDLDSITTFDIDRQHLLRAYYQDGSVKFFATSNGLTVNDSLHLLPGVDISSMTQDVTGNYWISTLNGGVYCLPYYFLQTSVFKGIYSQDIRYATAVHNRVLFVSHDNDVYSVAQGAVMRMGSCGNGERDGRESAYYFDSSGDRYFNFKPVKYYMGRFSGRSTATVYRTDTLKFLGVKGLFPHGGRLYLFSRSDILSFDLSALLKGRAGYYNVFNSHEQRIYGKAVSSRHGIWFSTLTATYRLQNNKAEAAQQYPGLAFKGCIFLNDYLIGYTHKNQLLIIDVSAGNGTVDTVPAQNCVWTGLHVLDSTHVLLSTSNYYRVLSVGNNGKNAVQVVEDPFMPRLASAIVSDSVNCFFFKGGDITVVPKDKLLKRAYSPRLYFTGIKAGAKEYRGMKSSSAQLTLSYADSRNVIISVARALAVGQSVVQQYSISKGGSDVWRELRSEEISLVNPGYGDVEIKIRARTLSSAFCTPVILRLSIARPFWATWWFAMLVIGSVVTMVMLIVRYRIKYVVRRNEQEHQNEMKFVKSEYKALNALMNPHFVFNTLNNVQGLVNRDDKLAANEYIRVFADLIRQNMHNLSKEMITLQKEMELVVNYLLLEKLRFKELLNYAIEIDDKLDLSEIFVPPLLIQPLVENSIKHGILPLESVEGAVVIRVYERDTQLFIEVRDNGVGLTHSRENRASDTHESFAMENIRKRIDQLAIILDKKISMEMKEEKLPGEPRQWTVIIVSMSA